jgi:chemotaxis protein methyltransferase CheR
VQDKQLDDNEYIRFRNFLEQQCGIVLGDNKLYLVKSRLAPLMSRFGGLYLNWLCKPLNPLNGSYGLR